MKFSRISVLSLILSLLAIGPAFGQTVSSSVKGSVIDVSGAVVVGATCMLTSESTGHNTIVTSNADGDFTFANVSPGTYKLTINTDGFKVTTLRSIVVTASELRTLGKIALQLGEMKEAVTVTADAAALQLASAEKSGLITGSQLNDIAVKGRDFMAFMTTMTGVVDTGAGTGREASDPSASGNISINGNATSSKNVTVDGMTDLDTGNNTGLHYEPNMDAIAEVKVLSSNYQAEYGRMGGGTVTIITKSGSQHFHGSAYDTYRNETLNANNFFNNRSNTAKSPYRYRITGYSIGGPVYIPKTFNRNKDKIFFFFSEEYAGIKQDQGLRQTNMPSALERAGNFSQSYDTSGALIIIKDPNTLAPFPNNAIPSSRINAKGQALLNAFPLPNYTDPDPKGKYSWNYRDSSSGPYPKRQEIAKIDLNLWPSIRGFYRLVINKDQQTNYYGHWTDGSTNFKLTPVFFAQPAKGHVWNVTKIFGPTLVSETTFGFDQNSVYIDTTDPSTISREKWGNLPKWYTFAKSSTIEPDYMPDIYFGGQPTNTPIVMNTAVSGMARYPWRNLNRNYAGTQNVTKLTGKHQIKFGVFAEHVFKSDPTPSAYRGIWDFSRNTTNPFDSNDSYSNVLLGNFNSYTESNARPLTQTNMWNVEWYVQDNWRITQRLTLDFGTRFYHWGPVTDEAQRQSTFYPGLYDAANAPILYRPGLNSSGKRVAIDPTTGATAAAAMIGLLVPKTGSTTNGIVIGGVTPGVPRGLETFKSVTIGPRFGFAYDLFGNGNTAIRGGWGLFFSRVTSGANMNLGGNPPAIFSPTAYYGNIDTVADSAGALGPTTIGTAMGGQTHLPAIQSFSLGLQQKVKSTVIEASYVAGLSRHLYASRNWNAIPIGARLLAQNQDPTKPGSPLPDAFLRPYTGYGDINMNQAQATSNYNSLQASANRRFAAGLVFGVSFTFQKALGTTSYNPYFDSRHYDYGPLTFDRSKQFSFNYVYDLPKLGKRYNSKPLGWVLDNWQVSGITSMVSGAPMMPTFTASDGAEITGSTLAARITVTGNPNLQKSDKTFYQAFNTGVFVRTPQGNFGNVGQNILRGPGVNNWDIGATKRFPLFSEQRYLQFRAEFFNAFNHTQFSAVNTAAIFNAAGKQTNALFGSYTVARDPRKIQFSARIAF